jgi:hypothetical protein
LPPSTRISVPVTLVFAAEARKTTTRGRDLRQLLVAELAVEPVADAGAPTAEIAVGEVTARLIDATAPDLTILQQTADRLTAASTMS